ncbi:sigma-70 family RNA polymerase sigma factor, partial [Antrihabitans cavernicola]
MTSTRQLAPPPPTIDQLEALRGPLTGYCYRMLGSAADTDDAVQETMIRAHRALDSYDAELSRLSTWVHRIATNICLDMLRGAQRRATAIDFGPARTGPGELGSPLSQGLFVEPMPDARTIAATDPAAIAEQRDSVRIAFIAALQLLAPRQRAVLILREVLAFSAEEAADVLETSVPAINSALQRARTRLAANRLQPNDVFESDDPEQRKLLEQYVVAFEAHDVVALERLLREDPRSSMPPFAWWIDGRDAILAVTAASSACEGDRLIPVPINGSPGFGQYRLGRPFAFVLAELRDGKIAHLTTFLGTADRFGEFGLPDQLERHLTKLNVKPRARKEVETPDVRRRAGRFAGSGAAGRGTC